MTPSLKQGEADCSSPASVAVAQDAATSISVVFIVHGCPPATGHSRIAAKETVRPTGLKWAASGLLQTRFADP